MEDQVFCVLHLYKRIIEKVITLLFTRLVDELASDEKTKRAEHIIVLQSYIKKIALGGVTKPCHWKCPVKNQQEVGDCSFTDGQANKVELQLPAQINTMGLRIYEWTVSWIALNGKEGMNNYTHCLNSGHVVYYLKYWRFFIDTSIKDGSILIYNTYMCIAIEHIVMGFREHMVSRFLNPIGLWFLRRLYWLTKGVDGNIPDIDKYLFCFY
jgi:hypothetical protein